MGTRATVKICEGGKALFTFHHYIDSDPEFLGVELEGFVGRLRLGRPETGFYWGNAEDLAELLINNVEPDGMGGIHHKFGLYRNNSGRGRNGACEFGDYLYTIEFHGAFSEHRPKVSAFEVYGGGKHIRNVPIPYNDNKAA